MKKVGRPRGSAASRVGEVAPVYAGIEGILSRLEALVAVLGNNRVARILGVSPSQPSRWRSGKDRPVPEMQRRIANVDHVMVRLFGDMHDRVALLWLEGHNEFLGAPPIDALRAGEFASVLAALDLEAQGGFL